MKKIVLLFSLAGALLLTACGPREIPAKGDFTVRVFDDTPVRFAPDIYPEAYNAPELCNSYCARECPIGRTSVPEVTIDDFDRLALKVLGSLKDIDSLRASLIAISEDGVIEESERPAFQKILDSLEKISTNAKALQLWAIKNIRLTR